MPKQYLCEPSDEKKQGRPSNQVRQNAFLQTCNFFENNDDEQLTISDLISKMDEYLQETEYTAYRSNFMKSKLSELYGPDIIITGGTAAADIITYRQAACTILQDYHKKPKDVDIQLQKLQLIEAAARLLRSDIKEVTPITNEWYPLSDDLDLKSSLLYLPESLRLLCSKLFVGTKTEKKN